MNYNKNDQFKKNIKLNKIANSNINVLKTCTEENNSDKNSQTELIHLSLLIDEGNKITTDFYKNEDISEICKKIQEQFKLSDKIKVKLQNRIQSQIKEKSNEEGCDEKDTKVNNLVKRLYNDSVEKTKNSKNFNEKSKKAKEEKELAMLKFTPTPSTFNVSNTKRKYAKIEDKLYYDSVQKKNKLEVDKVLKGISNYEQCRQYVYKENILKKNVKEEESMSNHAQTNSLNLIYHKTINSDKIVLRENSTLFSRHTILKSESSLGINRNKTDSEFKEDIFDSGKTDRKSLVEWNRNSPKYKKDIKEVPLKAFRMSVTKMSEENMGVDSRNKSKRTTISIDNTSINTNNIKFLVNQLQPENINKAGISPSPKHTATQALNKAAEFNLIIPDEQSVNCNKKKNFYADIYRKINNSNSSINNISNNIVNISKAQVSNKNLIRTPSISSAQFEEGKNSTTAKIIETTYNKLYADNRRKSIKANSIKQMYTTPAAERKSVKENSIIQNKITYINSAEQNIISHASKAPFTNEEINNLTTTKLNFGKILKAGENVKIEEEKNIRGPRHFSFKDFQDDSVSFGRNKKEEIVHNEKNEKLINKSEIEITSKFAPLNNQIPSKPILKLDANLNNTEKFTGSGLKSSNSFRNTKETMSYYPKNQKLMKKLENIHDRLYKSHEDIKKKKEDHVKNVFRNLYPFKPNVSQNRPKSVDTNSKFFSTAKSNNDRQNLFERLHSSNKTQNIARSILSSPSMASNRLSNTNFKTERSKKILSSKSAPILSTMSGKNSRQNLREKNLENELYDSFLKNNQAKEKRKNDALKKSEDNLNNFKLKNLKEIFEIIYNNCRSVEDFQNMEKFGITKLMKENLIIPTSFLINERNLDFNFGNFYLIANELMNNIIY